MSAVLPRESVPTIYVDPPLDEGRGKVSMPRPWNRRQGRRWRLYFPWVKTAVSAPTYNGELLIVNRTEHTWLLWHNYHALGPIDPGLERHFKLVRVGSISVRKLVADAGSEYLLLPLTPDLLGVEIVEIGCGEGFYTLRPVEASQPALESVPDSTSLKELGLTARTRAVLRRIGVTTAGELRRTDLETLWGVRDGPAAFVELVEMLSFGRGGRSSGSSRAG